MKTQINTGQFGIIVTWILVMHFLSIERSHIDKMTEGVRSLVVQPSTNYSVLWWKSGHLFNKCVCNVECVHLTKRKEWRKGLKKSKEWEGRKEGTEERRKERGGGKKVYREVDKEEKGVTRANIQCVRLLPCMWAGPESIPSTHLICTILSTISYDPLSTVK